MKEKNEASTLRKKTTAAATSRIPKISKKTGASMTASTKSNKPLPDVAVQTGLPPQVDGNLRSYLILRVGKVTWFAPRQHNDGLTMVLVKWWGEDGKGSLFIPVDSNVAESKAARLTTARYAIRSGPSQFSAYLSDMGSLHLNIVKPNNHHVKIGRLMHL